MGENVLRVVHTDIVGVKDISFHWFLFIAEVGIEVHRYYLYIYADITIGTIIY